VTDDELSPNFLVCDCSNSLFVFDVCSHGYGVVAALGFDYLFDVLHVLAGTLKVFARTP
jgi:hypothetical protein